MPPEPKPAGGKKKTSKKKQFERRRTRALTEHATLSTYAAVRAQKMLLRIAFLANRTAQDLEREIYKAHAASREFIPIGFDVLSVGPEVPIDPGQNED